MTAPQNPRVTQADRSRAVLLHKQLRPHMPQKWLTDLREGRCDNDRVVVTLARHREAAEAASKATEAALVEALDGAIPALEQDYEQAQEYGDADWEGLAYQRLHAARAALTKEPDA